jgi:hypothetical protein
MSWRWPLVLLLTTACVGFSDDPLVVRVEDFRANLLDAESFRSQVKDLDGDGIQDLVTFEAGDAHILVSLGTEGGGFDDAVQWTLPSAVRFVRDDFAWRGLQDHNSDDLADILAASPVGDELQMTFYRGRVGSFGSGEPWGTLPIDGQPVDLDGDGLTDWVRTADAASDDASAFGETGDWYWEIWSGGPTRFERNASRWSVPGPYTQVVGDWTGDGRMDALSLQLETDDPHAPTPGVEDTATYALYEGTTDGFAATSTPWQVPSDLRVVLGVTHRVVDITCDGLPDLVRKLPREGRWLDGIRFWVNTGDGFDGPRTLRLPKPENQNGTIRPLLLDLTGDGCRDLVYTTADGTGTLGDAIAPQWWVYEG